MSDGEEAVGTIITIVLEYCFLKNNSMIKCINTNSDKTYTIKKIDNSCSELIKSDCLTRETCISSGN